MRRVGRWRGGDRQLRVARVEISAGRGQRLHTFPASAVEQALGRHREILTKGPMTGEALLKRDHRARVTACCTSGRFVVVKEVTKGGGLRWLADRFRGSPARRAWRAGHGLLARGISAATPLAYLERTRFGVRVASWLLLEDLRPALPVDRLSPGQIDRSALGETLLALVVQLHRHGVSHGDLQASHVMVRAEGSPAALRGSLIDLEGLRFRRRLSERERIRALAQLNASLGDEWLSADERRLLFERYVRALPFRADPPAVLARVVAISLDRHHAWLGAGCALAESRISSDRGEPIESSSRSRGFGLLSRSRSPRVGCFRSCR